ncbi:MAG: PilZ domain-containing protein [Pseudolabrys sp.]|nr:PilZ domain-containing protein [Pseudolabrys sp.]MDP2296772.1 PilZ domain-containing protein [Pseudolabrys sp.]
MSVDLRKYPRMPGNNRAAVVYIKRHAPPIMCTVADISEGGAGLTFASIAHIPDTFELEIKGEAKIRSCKVAWRAEPYRMGVQFIEG